MLTVVKLIEMSREIILLGLNIILAKVVRFWEMTCFSSYLTKPIINSLYV